MYNQDIKERYINEKNQTTISSKGYLQGIFKKSEPFEKENRKDLCNFSFYEIENLYKTLNYSSIDTLYTLNSAYSLYTNWAINNNLVEDSQNHFLEFSRQILLSYINKVVQKRKVVSRSQVITMIDDLPNACDQFVLLGTFEGLSGAQYKELINAKVSDIHGNEIDLCTGRTIHVSDRLIGIAEESNETLEYYAMTNKMERVTNFIDNGCIIKDFSNQKEGVSDWQMGRRIYNKFMRSFNYLGTTWLIPHDLFVSGQIDMILRRSKELNISPRDYIYSPRLTEVNKQYNRTIVRSTFYTAYKDIFENGYEGTN